MWWSILLWALGKLLELLLDRMRNRKPLTEREHERFARVLGYGERIGELNRSHFGVVASRVDLD